MIRLFLVILLSLLLFSPDSGEFLEQFWASRSEPFVVVEFREDDHIEEAGVLGDTMLKDGDVVLLFPPSSGG